MKDAKIRFRTHKPDYSDVPVQKQDWFSVYGNMVEDIPKDMPNPLGKPV